MILLPLLVDKFFSSFFTSFLQLFNNICKISLQKCLIGAHVLIIHSVKFEREISGRYL